MHTSLNSKQQGTMFLACRCTLQELLNPHCTTTQLDRECHRQKHCSLGNTSQAGQLCMAPRERRQRWHCHQRKTIPLCKPMVPWIRQGRLPGQYRGTRERGRSSTFRAGLHTAPANCYHQYKPSQAGRTSVCLQRMMPGSTSRRLPCTQLVAQYHNHVRLPQYQHTHTMRSHLAVPRHRCNSTPSGTQSQKNFLGNMIPRQPHTAL